MTAEASTGPLWVLWPPSKSVNEERKLTSKSSKSSSPYSYQGGPSPIPGTSDQIGPKVLRANFGGRTGLGMSFSGSSPCISRDAGEFSKLGFNTSSSAELSCCRRYLFPLLQTAAIQGHVCCSWLDFSDTQHMWLQTAMLFSWFGKSQLLCY